MVAALLTVVSGVARPDTIDNFALTGTGHTTNFALPASDAVSNYIRLNSIYKQAPATVNGVGGYLVTTTFYFNAYLTHGVSLVFSINPAIYGVGDTLYGAQTVMYDPLTTPSVAALDFVPGVYSLTALPPVFSNTAVSYNLTITPEGSSVPEPGGMLLMALGGGDRDAGRKAEMSFEASQGVSR